VPTSCHPFENILANAIVFVGELNRVRQESKTTVERIEHLMDIQQQKALQAEKDLQIALQQEKMAHEEDVEKLIADRVSLELFTLVFIEFRLFRTCSKLRIWSRGW
jgi:hypothetical protein